MAAKYNILKALEFDKLSAAVKKKYPDVQALVANGWLAQRKYDGVFAKFTLRPGCTLLGTLESRTGHAIKSCDHIIEQIVDTLPTAHHESGCVLLGELWHQRLPFPTISGDVRRNRASPHLIFMMNDILPAGMVTELAYRDRFDDLSEVFAAGHPSSLGLAHTYGMECDVEALARQLANSGEGYDGAILRDPKAGYSIGLASEGQIVKVKPTLTLSLRVDKFLIGAGEKTGRPVYTAEVNYRGVTTTVGSGMPHKAAECPPRGAIIEVECLGLTADGKLREPRFKGIRHDVLEPDT